MLFKAGSSASLALGSFTDRSGLQSQPMVIEFLCRLHVARYSPIHFLTTSTLPLQTVLGASRERWLTSLGVIASRVYALDPQTNRVHVLTEPEGIHVTSWEPIIGCTEMAVYRDQLVLADFSQKSEDRVQIYSADGVQLSAFRLHSEKEFGRLCVSEDHEEIVISKFVDQETSRSPLATCFVQHFTIDGKFIREWKIDAAWTRFNPCDTGEEFFVAHKVLLNDVPPDDPCRAPVYEMRLLRYNRTTGTFISRFKDDVRWCARPQCAAVSKSFVFVANENMRRAENVLVYN